MYDGTPAGTAQECPRGARLAFLFRRTSTMMFAVNVCIAMV
jgi:hypothetical protein